MTSIPRAYKRGIQENEAIKYFSRWRGKRIFYVGSFIIWPQEELDFEPTDVKAFFHVYITKMLHLSLD